MKLICGSRVKNTKKPPNYKKKSNTGQQQRARAERGDTQWAEGPTSGIGLKTSAIVHGVVLNIDGSLCIYNIIKLGPLYHIVAIGIIVRN